MNSWSGQTGDFGYVFGIAWGQGLGWMRVWAEGASYRGGCGWQANILRRMKRNLRFAHPPALGHFVNHIEFEVISDLGGGIFT